MGKVTFYPYDKVLRLSPEKNSIFTGIKSMLTWFLKDLEFTLTEEEVKKRNTIVKCVA